MSNILNNDNNDDIHVKQIDPRTELNDLEKTAILQFKIDEGIDLSKTQQFKMINNRIKEDNDVELPTLKEGKKDNDVELPTLKEEKKDDDLELPALKNSLFDTIKIKISDLREAVDQKYEDNTQENSIELPKEKEEYVEEVKKKKKSLYDTVIIKLDDLINSKSALRGFESKKVTRIERTAIHRERFHLFKPKDITKMKSFKINVDSEEFGRQLYNLNKIALNNLCNKRPKEVRKYSTINKLDKIEKVHISKHNYLRYQQRLNKFAINKLYYKLAPKESKKYKLYKMSVILSSFVFFITSAIIINWFIQGISVNELSNALVEETVVETVDSGEVVNVEVPPEPETNDEYSKKDTLYWKYLNTPLSSVNFDDLLKQNSDTVGWIIVKNTNVNYPVVQTTNNDYYLHHSFNRKTNGAGWVFADFRNDFGNLNQNTVIYAHGRKDKVMFGSLTNTLKPNWYKDTDNQIIQFSTLKYNTMWQIFSIYKVEAESYYITTDFGSDTSYQAFIDKMKSRSIYDFGIDVNTNDKILTLSTCYNDNGIRLVVQAKLVKIQER